MFSSRSGGNAGAMWGSLLARSRTRIPEIFARTPEHLPPCSAPARSAPRFHVVAARPRKQRRLERVELASLTCFFLRKPCPFPVSPELNERRHLPLAFRRQPRSLPSVLLEKLHGEVLPSCDL